MKKGEKKVGPLNEMSDKEAFRIIEGDITARKRYLAGRQGCDDDPRMSPEEFEATMKRRQEDMEKYLGILKQRTAAGAMKSQEVPAGEISETIKDLQLEVDGLEKVIAVLADRLQCILTPDNLNEAMRNPCVASVTPIGAQLADIELRVDESRRRIENIIARIAL